MQWAASRTAGMEHVYRYPLRSRHFLLRWLPGYALGIGLGICSPYVFHSHHANFALFAAIQASCALAGLVVCALLVKRLATLTILPDGVLYQSGARRLWVLWRDIAAVGPSPGPSSRIGGVGLVVRPGALPPHTVGWRGTLARSFIPLEWFDPHWRAGAIGDDIRRYAPWLLDASGE